MYLCVRGIGFVSVFYGFSAKHAVLRRKSKDWLARNRDNVGRHVYSRTIASVSYANPAKGVGLVQAGLIII